MENVMGSFYLINKPCRLSRINLNQIDLLKSTHKPSYRRWCSTGAGAETPDSASETASCSSWSRAWSGRRRALPSPSSFHFGKPPHRRRHRLSTNPLTATAAALGPASARALGRPRAVAAATAQLVSFSSFQCNLFYDFFLSGLLTAADMQHFSHDSWNFFCATSHDRTRVGTDSSEVVVVVFVTDLGFALRVCPRNNFQPANQIV